MIFTLITENAVNLVVDAFFCLQKTNTMEKFACLLNLVFVVALNVSNDVYFDFFIDLDKHSGCDCIYSSTGSKKTGIYVDCFSEEEVVFESCKE